MFRRLLPLILLACSAISYWSAVAFAGEVAATPSGDVSLWSFAKESILLIGAVVFVTLAIVLWKNMGSQILSGILSINQAQSGAAQAYLKVIEGAERITESQERMTEKQVELASKMLEISTANAQGQRSFHESVEGLREIVTELRQVAREMREAREGGR
jgi:hypothetical protein